ncbi:Uncharacterized protein TCM_016295 [Theobroma cacao]|uniref:Uncharacterized protein n=1 Tax=Theobroma cacao TaxID=3641 RepID=A0A061GCM6_THECC|nr:Uncharacterized protein TCM_016295 [Theobroma cacao]
MPKTTMSILVEDCANQCSKHGIGQSYEDASGSTSYSCCSCDKSHWGFDFSIDLVSKELHGLLALFHGCAATDPTRATNIVLVVAAAFLALLVGCLQEFYTKHVTFKFSTGLPEHIQEAAKHGGTGC